MDKLVSIIIPVYNVEEYLSECLESVLNQTYRNLEVILVNDGTKDGSGKICQFYADIDKRVTYITQKNQGLSAARNTGSSVASGEYAMFVDSDDFLELNAVEELVKAIDGFDIAMCGFYWYKDNDNKKESRKIEKKEISENEFWKLYYNGYHSETVVVWNKLFRKGAVPQFQVGRINEDEFFVNEAIKGRISVVDKPLYYYRQREGSITKSAKTNDFADALTQRLQKFIKEDNSELARRTILYSLYIFDSGEYGDCSKQRKEIIKAGFHIDLTPEFLVKFIVRGFIIKHGKNKKES